MIRCFMCQTSKSSLNEGKRDLSSFFLKTNAPLNLVLAELAQVHRLGAAAAVAAASAQLAN